jgi:hypothetical protein
MVTLLCDGLPTFDLHTAAPLSVPCALELRHQHRLFKLRDGPEDLPDQARLLPALGDSGGLWRGGRCGTGWDVPDRKRARAFCARCLTCLPVDFVKALLNHNDKGVTGIYARWHMFEEKREAVLAIEAAVLPLLGSN